MPGFSGALKKFRDEGYPKERSSGPDEKSETPGVRVLKLTDDEAKELASYSEGDGIEQTCEVTGKLEGNTLRVMSVRSPGADAEGPDLDADAEEAMMKSGMGAPPIVQSQTLPSPS